MCSRMQNVYNKFITDDRKGGIVNSTQKIRESTVYRVHHVK